MRMSRIATTRGLDWSLQESIWYAIQSGEFKERERRSDLEQEVRLVIMSILEYIEPSKEIMVPIGTVHILFNHLQVLAPALLGEIKYTVRG